MPSGTPPRAGWFGVGVGPTVGPTVGVGVAVGGSSVGGLSRTAVNDSSGSSSPGEAMASSGSQVATGRLATVPSTVSGPASTHASVRPGAGKWIRSQVESSDRPVVRTC
jgi:hypothetical protein